jgi:hypothetical protein
MASIISYDIVDKHRELRRALLGLGYNTTLYHPEKTLEEAAIDVQKICDQSDIRLKRCIATDMVKWFILPDGFNA